MTTWNSGNPVPNPSNDWSNVPIVSNITAVRKAHLAELREALDIHDGHYHLFEGYTSGPELPDVSFTWTDATDSIQPGVTKIRAIHWTELRTAVENSDNHYHNVADLALNSTTLDLNVPGTWSTGLAAGEKPRKPHIDELRVSVGTMHNHTHTACCDSECGCDGHNPCGCQENCEAQCWSFD